MPSRFALLRALAVALIASACGSPSSLPLGPSSTQEPSPALKASQTIPDHEVGVGVSALSDKGTGAEVEFKGKIESVGSDQLKVSGVTVLVDAKTEIEGGDHTTLSQLKVGETVHVEGTLLPSGTVLARQIEQDDDRVRFHGPVKLLDADHVSVAQIVVVVNTSTTVMVDCNGASVTDIQNNQIVQVTGVLQDDGTVLAVTVNVVVHVSVEVTCRTQPGDHGDGDDDDGDD